MHNIYLFKYECVAWSLLASWPHQLVDP